jgi:hypothetical protein
MFAEVSSAATTSLRIRGHSTVMATLHFTYFYIKVMFIKHNRVTSFN